MSAGVPLLKKIIDCDYNIGEDPSKAIVSEQCREVISNVRDFASPGVIAVAFLPWN